LWVFGSTVFTGIVNAMHMRAALETLTWTWLQIVVFGMSFIYYFGFLFIYSYVFLPSHCASSTRAHTVKLKPTHSFRQTHAIPHYPPSLHSKMLDFAPTFYDVGYAFLNQPSFWLCSFLLVPVASWTFDATMRYCRLQLCPTAIDFVIERERMGYSIPMDLAKAEEEKDGLTDRGRWR